MATKRKSFVFNLDWCDALEGYPAEVRHEVYDAIIGYARSGKLSELKPLAAMAFAFIKREMDSYFARYDATVEARREAGKKGNETRWGKEKAQASQGIANATNLSQKSQNEQMRRGTHLDSDSDSVGDSDSGLSDDNVEKEIALTCKEKAQAEKPKKKSSEWKKPTVEEIRAFAEEKGYTNVDAEDFWNFYESKGWMVGSNHMTKWRASVALWNRGEHRQGKTKDKLHGRMHYEGEHDPHAYDEDEELSRRQKENGL